MKEINLKKFVNDVAHMSVTDFCETLDISERTLRHRWRSKNKRKEVILMVAGYTAENGAYAEELIERYF